MTSVVKFKNILKLKNKLFNKDNNGREIFYFSFNGVILCSETLTYPNCLLYETNSNTIYDVLDESIMSLSKTDKSIDTKNFNFSYSLVEETPVFYFVYNTDNYYHFIYDTLPYLISYQEIKKSIPELKLLVNYPNESKKSFYTFVKEFFDLFQIAEADLIFARKNVLYKNIIVSSSYTHGIDSNLTPRQEIYNFYQSIVNKAKTTTNKTNLEKIYISRRSWIHNDTSNIGTNYTTRRRMVEENELVAYLESKGFKEVFTETMTTIEKINLFSQVKVVVGAIGGGLCNILFCKPDTKLISINSPTFLNVNKRFLHSFAKVNTFHFNETKHTEKDYWKKYMRVKCGEVIGEIDTILNDQLIVAYTEQFVAGWNQDLTLKKITLNKTDCIALDEGLNSEWSMDLNKFKLFCEKIV